MKLIGRLVSAAVAAAVMLTGAECALAAPEYSDGFDAGLGENWTIDAPSGSSVTVKDGMLSFATPSDFGGKAVAEYTLPSAMSKTVSISYKVNIGNSGVSFAAPYIYSSAGRLVISSIFDRGGYFQTHTGGAYKQLIKFETGHLYEVEHILDFDKGTYDVTVDGEKYITGAAFRYGESDMKKIRFYAEKSNAEINLDDFCVRQLQPPQIKLAAFYDADGGEYTGFSALPGTVESFKAEFDGEVEIPEGAYIEKSGGGRIDFATELYGGRQYVLTFSAPLEAGTYMLHIPGARSVGTGIASEDFNCSFTVIGNEAAVTAVYARSGDSRMQIFDGMENVPVNIDSIELVFNKDMSGSAGGVSFDSGFTARCEGKSIYLELTEGLAGSRQYTITIDGEKIQFSTVRDCLYFEGFDMCSGGAVPWDCTGSVRTELAEDRKGNVLVIENNSGADRVSAQLAVDFARLGVPAGTAVVFDFDVYAEQSANASLPYINTADGINFVTSLFSSDSSITLRDGAKSERVCGYTQKEWHNVKICVDIKNGKYNYIYDGRLAADSFAFRNTIPETTAAVNVDIYIDKKPGRVMVDNFKIYAADELAADLGAVIFTNNRQTGDKSEVFAGRTTVFVPYSRQLAKPELTLESGGDVIEATAEVTAGGALLTPGVPLAYDSEYRLADNGSRSIYGSVCKPFVLEFTTEKPPVYVKSAELSQSGVSTVIASAGECTVYAIAAAYDGAAMTDCVVQRLTLERGDNSVNIETPNGADRFYLWNDTMTEAVECGVYTRGGKTDVCPNVPELGTAELRCADAITKAYPDMTAELEVSVSENDIPINFIVVRRGDGSADIAAGDIVYIGQGVSADNRYTVKFDMKKNSPTGVYDIYIGGRNVGCFAVCALTYSGEDAVDGVIDEINRAADADAMMRVIADNAATLAVPTDETEKIFAPLGAGLYNKRPFADLQAFLTAYYDVYLSTLFNSESDVSEYVDKYADKLGIDLSDTGAPGRVFKEDGSLRALTDSRISANTGYMSAAQIGADYISTAAINAINRASRGNICSRSELFAKELGLNMTGKYSKLSEEQKRSLAISLMSGIEYSSPAAYAAAFEKALAGISTDTAGGGGSSGGDGGSSSSSGGGFAGAVYSEPMQPRARMFSDVPEDAWYAEYVNALAKRAIVSGDENGRFNPSAGITRAELVKLLVVATGCYDASLVSDFEDVGADKWYTSYIASAKAHAIISGYNNRAMPEETVTRQDAAVMIAAMTDGGGEYDLEFSDAADISEYAYPSVMKAVAAGIMQGMGDGSYAPREGLTRAQAAVVICRLIGAA